MLRRKRALGGGRKPRGEFRGKSATLTTRIMPGTRKQLEHAAKQSTRSLSQEIEYRLVKSIEKDRDRARQPHVRALAEAVALIAQQVERATGKHWNEDSFTGQALQHAMQFLISHFAPHDAPVVPQNIEAAATLHIEGRDRTPATIGETEAGHVIAWIEAWNYRTLEVQAHRSITVVPEEWYAHEQLFRGLGSGWKRNQNKERPR